MNNNPQQKIFGIVSNGKIWEFGQLEQNMFQKKYSRIYHFCFKLFISK
jgi:hypothetical protein